MITIENVEELMKDKDLDSIAEHMSELYGILFKGQKFSAKIEINGDVDGYSKNIEIKGPAVLVEPAVINVFLDIISEQFDHDGRIASTILLKGLAMNLGYEVKKK